VRWNEVEARLDRAIAAFIAEESDLLRLNTNERTLTAMFAQYLRTEFPGWNVDVEYDKLGKDVKRVQWRDPAAGGDGQRIYPDIIVHHRNSRSNLLVIEAKKGRARADDDRRKVVALKSSRLYKYQHAILMRFVEGTPSRVEIERV
jgi:hypothetical protein